MQEGKRYSYLLKNPQKLFHIFTNCLQHLKYANRQLIVPMPKKKSKSKYIAFKFTQPSSYCYVYELHCARRFRTKLPMSYWQLPITYCWYGLLLHRFICPKNHDKKEIILISFKQINTITVIIEVKCTYYHIYTKSYAKWYII